MIVPAVTVVIPTKNRRELVFRAINSVLAQEHADVEVIVVDDGSEDGTATAVGAHGDPRVRVVRHETSQGVSRARNAGLDQVRTEWVCFLDDDDVWAPAKLRHQFEALGATSGLRWSICGAAFVDSANSVLWIQHPETDPGLPKLLRMNSVPGGGSGVLAQTELVMEAGGFDATFSILADWDLWIRLAERSEPAVVQRADVGYYQHERSMSLDLTRSRAEKARLFLKHRALYDEHGVTAESSEWHRYLGDVCLRNGRRREALAEFRSAGWPAYGRAEVAGKIGVSILFPRGLKRSRGAWLRYRAGTELAAAEEWLRHVPPVVGSAEVDTRRP